jgi:hypothetical protein
MKRENGQDAEGPKRLVLPAHAGSVRLQLEVQRKGEYQSYRAEVQTVEGLPIWGQDTRQAALVIPARVFAPGDYVIDLKGIDARGNSEEVGEYYFRVVAR